MALQGSGLDGLAELESQLDMEWFVEDLEWDAVGMSAGGAAADASPSTTKSSGGARKGGGATQRAANTCCQVGAAEQGRRDGFVCARPSAERTRKTLIL